MPEITGLLLAAGNGHRFGSGHKLLTPIENRPLILHSADSLSPCDRVIAVIRTGDQTLQQILLAAGIESVVNPQAQAGMSGSLACGIRASWESDAWCILPADMPYVSQATTSLIVAALRDGAPITAPFHQGRRGHPVGFFKAYRYRLSGLQGDQGAKSILVEAFDSVLPVMVDDPGILIDIDIPQDIKPLLHRSI